MITISLPLEQFQLLLDYADYGADEKEAWLDCDDEEGNLDVEDRAYELVELASVRDAIRALMDAVDKATP